MRDPAPLAGLVPLQRRDALAALLLAGVLLLGAGFRAHTGVCGQCHDDGIYVLAAKSLAEGNGYRLTNLPGEPPQTKYPPLYAACLALLWKLWPSFPANLILLQGFSMACGAAFIAGAYLYLVRFQYAGRGLACGACLLCAVYSSFLFFAAVTMSEALFGVLVLAMLWWLETAARSPEPRCFRDLLGGVLLALPFLCRGIGLLFIPLGLLLLWQYGKRWRGAVAGATLAALPWLLWSLAAANEWRNDPVQGYYTDYVGWWTASGLPALSRIVTANLTWITASLGSVLADGLTGPLGLEGRSGPWALLLIVPGIAALALLLIDVSRGRLLATMLAAYLVLVCVWPWMPHRFIIPMLPFLTVYLFRVLLLPARAAALQRGWLAGGRIVLALAVAGSAASLAGTIELRWTHDTPTPEQGEKLHQWRSSQRLLDWLQMHSDPGDVIASGADPQITLYTGRKAYFPIVCPPLALFYGEQFPAEEVLAASLRGMSRYRPRFLALTANFHAEDEFRAWVQLLGERHPGLLVLVYKDEDDPRFAIYEIHYPPQFP